MSAYTYALCAALIWGIAPIFEKSGLVQTPPLLGLAVRSLGVLIAVLLLLPMVPNLGEGLKNTPGKSILNLMVGGCLGSVVGQVFAYQAMKRADVSQVGPVMGSWPLLVVLYGWIFLGEPLSLKKCLGSGFIVLGVWLLR
ncbi:MAG: EamA family transporter [Elusimicrobia bacterium]|nr:EamA family transporter [Elusimicrobiota bacterium]